MKLRFYWHDTFGPRCESSRDLQGACVVLENILMDDGGIGYKASIPWLLEGIDMVRSVSSGNLTEAYWDRETFGAEIRPSFIRLSSHLEDSYAEVIDPDTFEATLIEWIEFLESDDGRSRIVEV